MRIAFTMQANTNRLDEYVDRHQPIWPELEAVLFEHGVSTYSIFMNSENGMLFAYAEIEHPDRWAAIAETDVCRRWWTHMAPLMETNADHSPASVELDEVFNISRMP